MSEVENNQETNGTSNGDVPEIELIIKEEYMLENEFIGSANESNINIVAAGERLNVADEKENIVQQHYIKDYKTINNDKPLPNPSRKDVLTKRHNESTEGGNVLMLTHYDNQHFHFEYVSPKQDENLLQNQINQRATATIQLSDNSNTEKSDDRLSVQQRNRVPFSQNHITEKVIVKDEHSHGSGLLSSLDFATMVAEACEGIFDEIEKDLRLYNNENDNNSYEAIELSTDTGDCSVVEERTKRARNSEAIQLAMNAVLEGGMTLGQAARRFNVVRSTLSSRVAKHPKRKRRKSKKQLEELIHSKLMAGVQISEISRSLHVPKSTVHFHKTRLKNSGLLSNVWIRSGNKDVVDNGVQERLMQAYRGHIVNGMSVRFAAEFFSLPITTLWRYIKRRKNATVTVVKDKDDDGSGCAANECSDGLRAFEDLEIDKNSQMKKCGKEENFSCSSSTCPTILTKVIQNEADNLEQSLIDQLLE